MTTKETNLVGSFIAFGLVICLLIALFIVKGTNPLKRQDSDCIEWGIEVENPNGTKSWAYTAYDPKNREEAERLAKQMEMEDVKGNRYYNAKCKRYK